MRTIHAGQRTSSPLLAVEILEGLRTEGAAVLRGFGADDQAFAELTAHLSERFTCDPAKLRGTKLQSRHDGIGNAARTAAKILDKAPGPFATRRTNGTRSAPLQPYGINPHNENSYIPGGVPRPGVVSMQATGCVRR